MDQVQIQQQFNQAVQAYEIGQKDMAEYLLRPLYSQLPNHVMIVNALVNILIATQKEEEAESIAERFLKKNPKANDLTAALASAKDALGKFDEAEKLFEQAIRAQNNNPNLYFNRANVYLKRNKTEKAEKDLRKCISVQSDFLPALINLGIILQKKGSTKEAEDCFEKVLETEEGNSFALINLGHCKADQGKLEEAVSFYEKALKKEKQNSAAWLALVKTYIDLNQQKKALKAVLSGIEECSESAELYLMAGNIYQATNNNTLAEKYFEKSLEVDPNQEGAKRNLSKLLNTRIPGWHFTMLADEKRNEAYRDSLKKVVTQDSVVLDIGTGSGLLAMMAAKAGAKKVYACEMQPDLAKAATEIVKQNEFDEKVEVLTKKSTSLQVGGKGIKKADVLVSEILDAGVIGEEVLPTLRHAIANLCKKGVKVIPAKAKLFGQLVEIPDRSKLNPIKEISGFDLSYFDRFRVPDEYTTVHLQNENYKVLSEEFFLHEYDFYNIPAAIQDNDPKVNEYSISVSDTGTLQAVVFWFDLYLDDEIMVSSRPGGELLHWGQALFCFSETCEVRKEYKVNLQMIHSDQLIRFKYML